MSALIPLLVTLPLLGAAVALFFGRARRVQVGVSLVTLTLVLVIAAVLLYTVDSTGQALAVSVGVGAGVGSPDPRVSSRMSSRATASPGNFGFRISDFGISEIDCVVVVGPLMGCYS